MVENCESCAFGVEQGSGRECRRHAPTAPIKYAGFWDGKEQFEPRTHWPHVRDSDFCGDWELTDARS
jgi:hypothetical protein